jgi:hypothetical protein
MIDKLSFLTGCKTHNGFRLLNFYNKQLNGPKIRNLDPRILGLRIGAGQRLLCQLQARVLPAEQRPRVH